MMGLQQPKEEGVLKWKRFGELINLGLAKNVPKKKINKGGCPKVEEYRCLFTKRKKFEIKSCIDG